MTTPRALYVTAVLVAGCTRADAADPATDALRPVVLHTITSTPLAPSVKATGVVSGKEEIPLGFKIGGLITSMAADPGQRVHTGQVLAELSPTEIAAATSKATEARAKAARDFDRARLLHADSVATLSQLQDATTALQVAEQDVRTAEFNRALSVIRAPGSGVILQRMAEPGALINPGVPVLVLRTERRGLVLRAGLADRDAMRVRVGDRAEVRSDAIPGVVIAGRVSQVAAAASPGSGTFEIEVALASTKTPLASGLIGQLEIFPASLGEYPRLPLEAIVEASGDSAVVFTVDAGSSTVSRRLVRLARIQSQDAAVSAGLVPGERVVVQGAAWLVHGQQVAIREAK